MFLVEKEKFQEKFYVFLIFYKNFFTLYILTEFNTCYLRINYYLEIATPEQLFELEKESLPTVWNGSDHLPIGAQLQIL